jgi:hypothetical protein
MKKIIGVSLAAILFAVFSCNTGSKPEEVVAIFIDAMNKQDFETARKHCTEETLKLVDFLSSIAEMAKQEGSSFADADPVSNVKCTVDGATAKCSFCCDGEGKDTEVDLVKVNNEWKVNIEFSGFGDMDMESLLDTTYLTPGTDELMIEDNEAESAQ